MNTFISMLPVYISNPFFEKKLNVPATTRNWKTVIALHKMAAATNA